MSQAVEERIGRVEERVDILNEKVGKVCSKIDLVQKDVSDIHSAVIGNSRDNAWTKKLLILIIGALLAGGTIVGYKTFADGSIASAAPEIKIENVER